MSEATLQMIIFDLDYTLYIPLIRKMGLKARLIVEYLASKGYIIAMASMNTMAPQILYDHEVLHKFQHIEYRNSDEHKSEYTKICEKSGIKTEMFRKLLEATQIPPENVLVFDDYNVNCVEARKYGMKAVHVNPTTLITWKDVDAGLRLFKSTYFDHELSRCGSV